MSNKKDNESQDTLRFRAVQPGRDVSDDTKIYPARRSSGPARTGQPQQRRAYQQTNNDGRRNSGQPQRTGTGRPGGGYRNESGLGSIEKMPNRPQRRPASENNSESESVRRSGENYRGTEPVRRSSENYRGTESVRRSSENYRNTEPVRRSPEGSSSQGQYTQRPRNPQSSQRNQSQTRPQSPAVKAKSRKNPVFSFFKVVIWIVVIVFLLYSSVALYYISKVSHIENTGQYTNDDSQLMYSSNVKNILVIGTDARDTSTRGLSDSMILMSIDKKQKKIFMTSFMRDMYTEIQDHGSEKINAAYQYGGSELLIDTIEDNFKIRIDGCVTVNFSAVAYVVDAFGGVEITISDSEAEAINTILCSEVNEIMGDDKNSDFLKSGGTYKLNGKQALSYSRIRYVGDADFERTQRQRTVMSQLMKNMKKINPVRLNKNMKKALGYIGSDMSTTDMYLLSLRLPSLLIGYDIEQMRIPGEDTWWYDETDDGQSILGVDFAANTEILKNKIYLSAD